MFIDPPVILSSAIYLLYSEENIFIDPPCHIVISYLPLVLQEKHVYDQPVILLSAIYLLYSEENMFIDQPCHIFISYLPFILRGEHVY